MTYEQRKQERQALIDHLMDQDWNVFGTLKFVNGRTIGRSSADKLLRSYWNRIDRMFFGKAAERQNMRVPRWCFAHEGSDHENYPRSLCNEERTADTETCAVYSTQCGRSTILKQRHWQRTGSCQYRTVPQWPATSHTSIGAWAVIHSGQAQLDCRAVLTSRSALDEHYTQQQAQRIQRAASPLWLRQAQQALDDHNRHI